MTSKPEDGLPLVSIITPSLNSGAVIEATMGSVFRQQYPRIEYIVIDGGSRDNTRDIILQQAEKIVCWVSEPDNGISDAFNKGIRASSGEIVGIINAGDRYTDGAVASAVTVLSENPDCDFVYGDIIYTDREGTPKFLMKAGNDYGDKIRYTMPALPHPTVFMRKSVYETCGLFDTDYRIAMDYEFLLRITLAGKRGRSVGAALAYMSLGGVSYAGFYGSYREVCRASIMYGYSPLKAYVRLYLKGLRGMGRVLLERFGLDATVSVLRRIFWNVKTIGNDSSFRDLH